MEMSLRFISLSVCSSVERNEHDDREPPDSGACLSRELPRARASGRFW